jgi:hypothetical protein
VQTGFVVKAHIRGVKKQRCRLVHNAGGVQRGRILRTGTRSHGDRKPTGNKRVGDKSRSIHIRSHSPFTTPKALFSGAPNFST